MNGGTSCWRSVLFLKGSGLLTVEVHHIQREKNYEANCVVKMVLGASPGFHVILPKDPSCEAILRPP